MSDPHPLDPVAYFKGTQPLWRAFWLWFVCGSGSIAWGYYWVEYWLAIYSTTTSDDWLPLVRCLRVWSVLGVTSLIVILRCHRNTTSPIAGMAAFIAAGLPTAPCVVFLLWFMIP